MADNIFLGKKGEDMAAGFLLAQSYTILRRNFRSGRGEIDIIARFENHIIFVEVKWRSRVDFGFPEEAVSEAKANLIAQTAEAFLEEINWEGAIRFDIIAITGKKIEHFIDAF